MLMLSGKARKRDSAVEALQKQLRSGAAFAKFQEMVSLQGGDAGVLDDPARLPTARLRVPLRAPSSGYVATVSALHLGKACVVLGAGRTKVDDKVDPAVGLTGIVKVGAAVRKGDPLLTVHANGEAALEAAMAQLGGAVRITGVAPEMPALIVDTTSGKS